MYKEEPLGVRRAGIFEQRRGSEHILVRAWDHAPGDGQERTGDVCSAVLHCTFLISRDIYSSPRLYVH